MILIATHKRDISCDFVVRELHQRGASFFRLNTEDLAQATFRFSPGVQGGWRLETSDGVLDLAQVRGAYYRRPLPPEASPGLTDAAADYVVEEWSAVLRSLWNALEGRWLNSPFAIQRAEDKLRQLNLAHSLGLDMPESFVTNDFVWAVERSRTAALIAKPLRHALLEDDGPGAVIFTSRIGALGPDDEPGFRLAPAIFQKEIEKQQDIRVTVVGGQVFAVAIDSQSRDESQVDWRRGSNPDLAHALIDLPADLANTLIALVRALDLRFGAIDLILDRAGRYWFLEINPNGQWAWIENRTGAPIAAAIVDLLDG